MQSLAKTIDRSAVSAELRCAHVVEAGDGVLVLEDGARRLPASRAAGCLLAPEVGDEVPVALTSDDRALVTCVLNRQPGAASRLELEGDVELCAPGGRSDASARARSPSC